MASDVHPAMSVDATQALLYHSTNELLSSLLHWSVTAEPCLTATFTGVTTSVDDIPTHCTCSSNKVRSSQWRLRPWSQARYGYNTMSIQYKLVCYLINWQLHIVWTPFSKMLHSSSVIWARFQLPNLNMFVKQSNFSWPETVSLPNRNMFDKQLKQLEELSAAWVRCRWSRMYIERRPSLWHTDCRTTVWMNCWHHWYTEAWRLSLGWSHYSPV